MYKIRIIICSIFFIYFLNLISCTNYKLSDSKPYSYRNIKKIYVPMFKNETIFPRVSSLVTNALLKELQIDGTYEIVDKAQSDAVLVGNIKKVSRTQLRSFSDNTLKSKEFLFTLHANFHFEDPVNGKIINFNDNDKKFSDRNLVQLNNSVFTRNIQVMSDNFQIAERNSLSNLSEEIAKKIAMKLTQGW